MPRIIYFTLVLLSLTCISSALDLTPVDAVWQGNEGPPIGVTQVSDVDKNYTFRVPGGWLVSGGPKMLRMGASDSTQAWMKLIAVPFKKDDDQSSSSSTQSDPQSAQDALQTWATQFLPPNAAGAQFIKSNASSYSVAGHPATEFIFSFASNASHDMISVSVIDFNPKERLVVLISAGQKDFETARNLAIGSLGGWREEAAKPSPSPSAH